MTKKTAAPAPAPEDELPPEEMVAVIARVPKSLRDAMKEIAAEEERTVAGTIRMLCARYVAERQAS